MAEQRSSRRLNRADVLVVAVICLLPIVLVPVLFARPRGQGARRVCAVNLARIGTAMLAYANDHEGKLPRAGGPGTGWGPTPNWAAADRRAAFGLAEDGSGGTASISSCFYLLAKYYEIRPRRFVCPGDKGTTKFKIRDHGLQLVDAWDFGPSSEAYKHCGYAYHIPFGSYALTTSGDPNLAVAADRNPWIASPAADLGLWVNFKPDIAFGGGATGTSDDARQGNSITHRQHGQNVLFLDGRVSFEKRAFCAVDKDNIYTIARPWIGVDAYGMQPLVHASLSPASRKDSLLVHDPLDPPGPASPPDRAEER